jgi:hypothetical protein
VLRASILVLVLTMTAGSHAAWLCKAWCTPPVTADGCHDQQPANAPIVAAADSCDDVALSVPLFVREDGPRRLSSPDAGSATPGPRFALPIADVVSDEDLAWRDVSHVSPPILTALRI